MAPAAERAALLAKRRKRISLEDFTQALQQGKVEMGYHAWSGGAMFDVSPQIVRHFVSADYADADLNARAIAANFEQNDRLVVPAGALCVTGPLLS